MKKIMMMILTITLISCNQKTDKKSKEFKEISADDLNQLLVKKGGNLSAKEIMKLFYPNEIETREGNEKIKISEKTSDNGNIVITLIHDNQLDDSVKGEKYIMELQRTNDKWIVTSIKKNWKCWDGRGHTDWGIELCK